MRHFGLILLMAVTYVSQAKGENTGVKYPDGYRKRLDIMQYGAEQF